MGLKTQGAHISRWWPADHTVTGEKDLTVVMEGGKGREDIRADRSRVEHDWGEVTVWEPPNRLGYRWHLRRDRSDATEVEIQFVDLSADRTRVEIEHRGWERLGAEGEERRDRNYGGWRSLLPHYVSAAEMAN